MRHQPKQPHCPESDRYSLQTTLFSEAVEFLRIFFHPSPVFLSSWLLSTDFPQHHPLWQYCFTIFRTQTSLFLSCCYIVEALPPPSLLHSLTPTNDDLNLLFCGTRNIRFSKFELNCGQNINDYVSQHHEYHVAWWRQLFLNNVCLASSCFILSKIVNILL